MRTLDQIAAFFGSFSGLFSKTALFFVCGGLGNFIGYASALNFIGRDWELIGIGFVAYPLILFLNFNESIGVIVTLFAIILFTTVVAFDVDVLHFFGLLLPLQALATFTSQPLINTHDILRLIIFTLPIVTVYAAVIWRTHKT